MRTQPLDGGPDWQSLPHKGDMNVVNQLDFARLELEAMPDHVDMSPPFRD